MADAVDAVCLQHLSIHPNSCPIDDPLDIEMEFTTCRPLCNARWKIKARHSFCSQLKPLPCGSNDYLTFAMFVRCSVCR